MTAGWAVELYHHALWRERAARKEAGKLWSCWEKGAAYEEIAHGGVGISHLAIRSYVKEKLARLKREARQHSVQASRLGGE